MQKLLEVRMCCDRPAQIGSGCHVSMRATRYSSWKVSEEGSTMHGPWVWPCRGSADCQQLGNLTCSWRASAWKSSLKEVHWEPLLPAGFAGTTSPQLKNFSLIFTLLSQLWAQVERAHSLTLTGGWAVRTTSATYKRRMVLINAQRQCTYLFLDICLSLRPSAGLAYGPLSNVGAKHRLWRHQPKVDCVSVGKILHAWGLTSTQKQLRNKNFCFLLQKFRKVPMLWECWHYRSFVFVKINMYFIHCFNN